MPGPRLPLRTVPDMSGRTVLITGANSGLGKETALAAARAGATVVMGARDPARGAAARDEVVAASGSDRVELLGLDLASVASVGEAAAEVVARHPRLDVLVNNAGLITDARAETVDGFEMMVGVNHLGHHLLTRLLTPSLVAAAPARVVVVASLAHRRVTRPLDADALAGRGRFSPFLQYGRSKLANVLFARELDRRMAPAGVTAVCLHPGSVRSGFGAEGDHAVIGALVEAFGRLVLIGPERGARTQVALAATPDVTPFAGAYVVRGRAHRPSRLARDPGAARWLWEESERLLADAGAPR